MAEFIITDPRTGVTLRLEGDSAPTEAELENIFSERQLAGLPQGSAMERARGTVRQPSVDFPTFALGTPVGRFIEGAADLPLGAAQFITESLGSTKVTDFLKKREQRISTGREAVARAEGRETGGFDIPRFAGNIALAVALTKGIPISPTIPGRIVQGAGIGAVTGAAVPAVSEDIEREKTTQIAVGGATGGVIPAAGGLFRKAGQMVRNLVDPFLPGGIQRAVRETAAEAVEGPIAPVTTQLRAGGTTEQALGRTDEPTLAGLARQIEGRAPKELAKQTAEENASRIAAVRQAGGGTGEVPLAQTIDDLIKTRTQQTAPLFTAASKSTATVTPKRANELVDGFIESDPNNQKLIPVLNQIKQTLTGNSPRELISASQNIGRLMSEKGPTGQRVNEAIVRQLNIIKKALDNDIGKAVPEFKQANALFQELSEPVNRAQVAQRLEQKLTSPLAGDTESVIQQRGAQFASALDDERKLIAQATGFKRGTGLDKFFSEEDLTKIGNIADRLKNDAEFSRLATIGRGQAGRITQDLEAQTLVNPLNRIIMVINRVLTLSGRARKEETLNQAAQVFRDPKKLAGLLDSADPAQRGQIKTLLDSIPIERIATVTGVLSGTFDSEESANTARNTALELLAR